MNEITRMPARPMTERQLQQSVTDLCRLFHLLCYHTRDSRGSAAGFPDLVIIGSRIVYAELKSEHGKTTIQQRCWRDGIKEAGGTYYLWTPADWYSGDIRAVLESLCCPAVRHYVCIVCRARRPVKEGICIEGGAWVCGCYLTGNGRAE
jgi:hypothetical protein